MFTGLEQRQMFALPVNINQHFAQRAEELQRGVAAIDAAGVAPIAAQFSRQHDLAGMVPVINAFCVEQGFNLVLQELWNLEDALDHGSLGPGPDKIRISATAEQEIDRINDDGLPGSGFSGDDVSPFIALDFQTFNISEVFNSYFTQHKLLPVAQTRNQGIHA